jgi:hypothetical protein
MGFPVAWGWAALLLVPSLLWLCGYAAAKDHKIGEPRAVFIGGSDHRLSLSRLQALAWTLVIFGTFAAAMVVSSKVTATQWIKIPDGVLQLAGIAIGSGVFSSLIAVNSGEEKTAQVTGLAPGAAAMQMNISGTDFGVRGSVRLNKVQLLVLAWTDMSITVSGAALTANTLIVETGNGKACYTVTGTFPTLQLGAPKVCYEFVDLFTSDKSPDILDLMKFQMFGWTVIAIVIYVVTFLATLSNSITQLPGVDSSIVILTGVSQAGYLTGKAAGSLGQPK